MLKPITLSGLTVCALLALPNARAVWEYVHKPFEGRYVLYGGLLSEAHPPTPGDTKLVVNLTGNSAKEMFDALGPDLQTSCAVQGYRVRQRDMLLCRFRAKDGYWCSFGFDLSTGLVIGGSVGGAACQN
jgi:hypothetical protein